MDDSRPQARSWMKTGKKANRENADVWTLDLVKNEDVSQSFVQRGKNRTYIKPDGKHLPGEAYITGKDKYAVDDRFKRKTPSKFALK